MSPLIFAFCVFTAGFAILSFYLGTHATYFAMQAERPQDIKEWLLTSIYGILAAFYATLTILFLLP